MKTNITVSQIIQHKNVGAYAPDVDHGIQDAIAAAYWAGEAKARAEEREANRIAVSQAPKSRYHKLIQKSLAAVNVSAVEGLKSESAEFAGWTHVIG